MNTTQKMIAAVAIVAVLAVAAVGAGFAYTASTSNDSNSTSSVYFILDQGNTASDYSDAFDAEIRYDSTRGIVDGADDLSEVDYDGAAAEAAEDEKTAMDTAAGSLKTEIADITGYGEVDVDDLEAYSASDLATLLTAIKTAEDVAAETAFNTFIEAAEAFLDAYNTASIKTTYTFNAVAKGNELVNVVYLNVTTENVTESSESAKATAKTEMDDTGTALVAGLAASSDEQIAAYKTVTLAQLETSVDITALGTAINAMTGDDKDTVLAAYDAFKTDYDAYNAIQKFYVLSGDDGKAFTVSHGQDAAIPQYKFSVSKTGTLNTEYFSYVVGVKFGTGDLGYKSFTGADAVSFVSSDPGEEAVHVMFYIHDMGTNTDPTVLPFDDLTFNFEVEDYTA